MDPLYCRTPWCTCLLRCFVVLTRCCWIVWTWTPGARLRFSGNKIQLKWWSFIVPSQQGNYTCPALTFCNIANRTITSASFYQTPSSYILKGPSSVNLSFTISWLVNISSCVTTLPFASPALQYNQLEEKCPYLIEQELVKNCITWNINNSTHNVKISLNNQYLICSNASEITNRSAWIQYLLLLLSKTPPTNHPPSIVRVPKSCVNTSISQHKIVLHYKVSFPPLLPCNKFKRAWYDTVLGGAGTGLGIVNSIDLETLASRLRSAGQDVYQDLTVNANWLPMTIQPHQNTLRYQGQFLQVFNDSVLANFKFDDNVTRLFKWTKCSLQNMYTLIQKENAQRLLQVGDTHIWDSVLPRMVKYWKQNKPEQARCTPFGVVGL
ncbi:uncharacterized protein LOC141512291 [Macrotis lagotis]|uniref:uncharacterized protein LOC141512291 n=1 Tax=Macrotis lagotis TaxID=92651 RepID=UPI003D6887F4